MEGKVDLMQACDHQEATLSPKKLQSLHSACNYIVKFINKYNYSDFQASSRHI